MIISLIQSLVNTFGIGGIFFGTVGIEFFQYLCYNDYGKVVSLWFSVVDDESSIVKEVASLIRKEIAHISIDIDCYTSARAFIENYTFQKYDAIFLDIDMPEINGFALARDLRNKNDDTPIVYITCREDLIYQSFRYKPIGFIRKQYLQSELPYAVESVLSEIQRGKPTIEVTEPKKLGGKSYIIHINQITHIESLKHYAYIHLISEKQVVVRQSLNYFLEQPEFEDFVITTNGVIANLFLAKIIGDSIVFDNGTKLYITRRRLPEVLSKYKTCKKKVLI